MNSVYTLVRAFVQVMPGMRVQYLPPPYGGGEDYRSDRFFEDHYGKKGTVTNFVEELVGPFDFQGRLPGVYADPDSIKVVFDNDQEERRLKYVHLAVIGDHPSLAEKELLQSWYRLRDLPKPIAFYQGDIVCKKDDLLKVGYEVVEVTYDDVGHQQLTLKDSDAIVKRAEERKNGTFNPLFAGIMPTFGLAADEATLVKEGPVRLLYENRIDEVVFASSREAMEFWTEQALSKVVYPAHRKIRHMIWYDLDNARIAVADGHGHFFMEDRLRDVFVEEPKSQRYHVYRLHSQFAMHAERAAHAATQYFASMPKAAAE